MLKKIISGGQTGSDIAGILAAERFGLETGGWIPKGFLTQAGPQPQYGPKYGFKEHSSSKYPPRTWANVADSDATIRLAYDFQSSGEKLTISAIQKLKKPHVDVDFNNPRPPQEVADWITRHNIEVLNVAGNSEYTYGGVTGDALEYLAQVLLKLGFKEKVD